MVHHFGIAYPKKNTMAATEQNVIRLVKRVESYNRAPKSTVKVLGNRNGTKVRPRSRQKEITTERTRSRGGR